MRNHRKRERQEQAAERQAERDARTDEEQIQRLQSLPGESKREIARLRARIEKAKNEARNNKKKKNKTEAEEVTS